MMKILHMISGGDTGGAKTHVFSLMRELPKYCDVKIVCFIKGQFFDELQSIDVESELIEQKSRFDLSVVSKLCDICNNEKIEIIHAHGARANFIASHLKKKVKIPVVTTVHSDYLLDFDGIYKKFFYTLLNVHSLKKLDYYIGVSSAFKDMLISRKFSPNDIYTVYNGMDYSLPMEYVSKEQFARRIGIEYDKTKTYVGLIGRHDKVKGHDVFIRAAAEALKQREDLVFVIAGDGDGRDELVALAKKLGIEKNVIFAGFVKDIYSFINFIDINTLSSRCESFPYVLLEGARMKKPTICSRVGGIPDLISDGKTGLLFDNEDYKMFAQKILTFVEDKEFACVCGEALFERATNNFSNTALAKTHKDIYESVLRSFNDKKRYDAVLSGYYGFNNSGDDALLFGIVEGLKNVMPDIRLCVLSNNPNETRKIYRVDSMKRFSYFGVHKALSNAKLLINGGGSLIQDATSLKSLLYYLYVIRKAQKKGIGVFVYANGIGPISDKNLDMAQKVLSKCDVITLRDELSLSELVRMGVDTKDVRVTADPAVTLEPEDSDIVRTLLEKEGVSRDMRILCVAVRPWEYNDKSFGVKIASLCDYCYEKYGLTAVFLPMKPSSDYKFSLGISSLTKHKSFVLKTKYSVSESIGIISCSEFVLGMRLHSLIYALCAQKACIGLQYDPKIDGFIRGIDINLVCSASDIDENRLKDMADRIVSENEDITQKMKKNLDSLRQKAKSDCIAVLDLINE